ncbi:stress response protein NST1-like [Haliotis rufescens]|uniref:stress response protein NST1-like n=1 Tax=Haliotis rufescens TaxID=6454 RepID=UPI00201EBED0|nr:stress response protein NST1-like [Haliotis rufescens]
MVVLPQERLKRRQLLSPILEAGEGESNPSNVTRAQKEYLLVQYMDLKSQVGDLEESLLDHLFNENKKLLEENERQRREVSHERELRLKAEAERQQFRLDYYNYKLSFTMEQAELREVKKTLEELAGMWETEKKAEEEQRKKLEEELKQLKSHHQLAVHELAALQRHTAPLTCQTPGKTQPSLPSVAPPVQPKKAHRPYTGRSKNKGLNNASSAKSDLLASGDSLIKVKVTKENKDMSKNGGRLMAKDSKQGQIPAKTPIRTTKLVSVTKQTRKMR